MDVVKYFHHYLQGAKFRIGTDHASLHTVLTVREPEGQLARCIVPGFVWLKDC